MTKSNRTNKFQSRAAGGQGVSVQSVSTAVEPASVEVPGVLPVSDLGDQPTAAVPATEVVADTSDAPIESAGKDQPVAEQFAEESVSDPAEAPLTLLIEKIQTMQPELTTEKALAVVESLVKHFNLDCEQILAQNCLIGVALPEMMEVWKDPVPEPVARSADHDDLDAEQARVEHKAFTDALEAEYPSASIDELNLAVAALLTATDGDHRELFASGAIGAKLVGDYLPKVDSEEVGESGTDTVTYSTTWREEQHIPAEWSNDDIELWLLAEGEKEGRTANGSFIIDPTRLRDREISSWGLPEIEDGFALKLLGINADHFGAMVKQLRKLTDVPTAWSTQEVIDNITQQIIPKKTANGAWLNDVTRAHRPATDWTSQELEAWADGQLKTPHNYNEVKLAIELNKRFDLKCLTQLPADVIRLFKQSRDPRIKPSSMPTPQSTVAAKEVVIPVPTAVKELPQGLTKMNISYIESTLQQYYDTVAPGTSITVAKGEAAQRQLDTLFRYILKLDDVKGFKSAMDEVREFIRKHRDTLFSATYVFRFTGALRTDQNIQETHINLLDLFNVFTDPTKLARAQCDVPTMVAKFPADRQTWLIEYFTKYC